MICPLCGRNIPGIERLEDGRKWKVYLCIKDAMEFDGRVGSISDELER